MKVLVLNCGSSSAKFQLFETHGMKYIAGGLVERVGFRDAGLAYYRRTGENIKNSLHVQNHEEAIDLILKTICHPEYGDLDNIHQIEAVGHRVVHGGETFTGSVLIDEAVFRKIKECIRFAPLHNPPNIQGIRASLHLIPFARQVAVFDTAFHQSMESHAYIYALPYEWYEKYGVRRYGFHGTSHRFVANRAAQIVRKPIEELKIITCHLGNGSSITAVDGGKCVDTSMGFTPLEGMVMGTRCGDIDPAIPLHIMEEEGLTPAQMDTILNKESGLRGITGGDNDLRTIEDKAEAGSEPHRLALKIFAHRVKKYIGAYAAVMGGVDIVVFTAGIGENSSLVRQMSCAGLSFLGIEITDADNKNNETIISRGKTLVLVIPTNEELAIAQQVEFVLRREEHSVEKEELTS